MNIKHQLRMNYSHTHIIVFTLTFVTSAFAQEATNWGPAVNSTQMSITVSNPVVVAGSNATLTVRIRNSSTNNVAINDTGAKLYDYDVALVNSAGKVRDFTPKEAIRVMLHNTWIYIRPDSIHEDTMTVPIDSNIEPGRYTFVVKQLVLPRVNDKLDKDGRYQITSNLLEVQVK
jgi:hypothetical protein